MTMETKETGIAQWVESRQIPDDLEPVMVNAFGKDPFDNILKDYEDRIKETKRKIESLITKELDSDRYKTFAEYQESDLNLICSAIGVYNILRWEGDDNQVREYWTKNGMNIFGNEWPDYLGDQSIRKGGGHIVVMLSHAGVVHLNEIADKVSSYITTVTV